jgi:hypothetical protein
MNIYSELFISTLNNDFDWINPILNIPIEKKNESEKTEFENKLKKFKWKFAKQKQFFNKTVKAIKIKELNEQKFKKLKINKKITKNK